MEANGHGKEMITAPEDIMDAFDTIKAIEMFGYALEETTFKPKWFAGITKSMDILRKIHDDLVSRLPEDVVKAEQAKQVPKPSPILKSTTVPAGVA